MALDGRPLRHAPRMGRTARNAATARKTGLGRITRGLRALCAGALSLSLAACAGPVRVDFADYATDDNAAFAGPTTLPRALAYAREVRETYRDRISSQMLLSRGVGLAAIGALSGAGYIATAGGSRDLATGLAIGAAGAVGADQFLTSETEQLVYAAGAIAIACAIDSAGPLHAAKAEVDAKLRAAVLGGPSYAAEIWALSVETERSAAVIDGTPQVLEGRAAVAKAHRVAVRARSALIRLDTAGASLVTTVDAIRAEVQRELIKEQPNIGAFAHSLSTQLKAFAPTPPAGPTPQDDAGRARIETSQREAAALFERIAALEARTATIDSYVKLIETASTLSPNGDCVYDREDGRAPLTVAPGGEQTVNVKSATTTLAYLVAGGRPPYSFNWVGPLPPATVTHAIESGVGEIYVQIGVGTPSGEYAFEVADAAGRKVFGRLTISGSEAPNPNAGLRDIDDGIQGPVAGSPPRGGGSGERSGGAALCFDDSGAPEANLRIGAIQRRLIAGSDFIEPNPSVSVTCVLDAATEAGLRKAIADTEEMTPEALVAITDPQELLATFDRLLPAEG